MLILFSISINTDTKEAVTGGNVSPEIALRLLQDVIVADKLEQRLKEELNKIESGQSDILQKGEEETVQK